MDAIALFATEARYGLPDLTSAPRKKRRTPPKPPPDVDHVKAWLPQARDVARKTTDPQKKKKPGPPEVPIATAREINFRHGHWRERRARIIEHLSKAGTPWHTLERVKNCGANCRVQWSEKKQRRRLRATYCRCRHCEPCMRAKANLIAANLARRLADRPRGRYRFITLTLTHTDTPLVDQLRRLIKAFKKLRQMPIWKTRDAGGVFTIEVKHNGTHWHPHLHVIDEGGFVHFKNLSEAWLTCTGDSRIVDVRRIDNGQDAAHYVTKYVTKGCSPNVWQSDDTAQEWITSVKGVRTCATYGSWRGFQLLKVTDATDDWIDEMSLEQLLARCDDGDVHAKIVRQLLIPAELDPEVCSQAR